MQLLLERKQASSSFRLVPLGIGTVVLFKLWAKVECSNEEKALLERYDLRDALLVAGDFFEDLRRSVRLGFLSGLVLALLLFPAFGIGTAILWGVIAFIVVALVYYNEIRENIYVRDMLEGRKFRCLSIVELVKKEAYLQHISNYLRQVLETAKHWDDREVIEIEPLSREEAKAEVLRTAA